MQMTMFFAENDGISVLSHASTTKSVGKVGQFKMLDRPAPRITIPTELIDECDERNLEEDAERWDGLY